MAMLSALSGMPSVTRTPALSYRVNNSPDRVTRLLRRRSNCPVLSLFAEAEGTNLRGCNSLRLFSDSVSDEANVAAKSKTKRTDIMVARAINVGSPDEYADANADVDAATGGPSEEPASRFPIELYFTVWWTLNAVFNIYNKKVLNVFPFPWLTSVLSLATGSAIMLGLWGLRLVEPPDVDLAFAQALAPVAAVHTIGFVAATVSLSKIAVSSHHVIKSLEPACSVIISTVFLGETFSPSVYRSLVPIIGGCGLAAATELNFSTVGFVGAMISNVAFVVRNIASKRGMRKGEGKHVGGMNYYACLSMMSCLLLLPFAFAVEGPSLWAVGWQSAVQSVGNQFPLWVTLQCVLYHLHNQVSYMSLDQISPLSFSIGNTMKRVTVIATSIIIFRTPVSPINALGAGIAILGTFLYSQAL